MFKRKLFILSAFVLLTLAVTLSPARGDTYPNDTSPLGTNFEFFRDWSSEYVTVDAFKQSRPWIPQCMTCMPTIWDTGEQALLDLDAHGWLCSLPAPNTATFTSVGTLMFQAQTDIIRRDSTLCCTRAKGRWGTVSTRYATMPRPRPDATSCM